MRVWSEVSKSWKPLIEKIIEIEGYGSISEYLRSLIREDLKRRGFLKNGVQNDPPELEVTA